MRRIAVLVAAVIWLAAAPAAADEVNGDARPTPMPTPTTPPPPTPTQKQTQKQKQKRSDRRRLAHAIAIGGFSAVYLISELAIKDRLVPGDCRWCEPPSLDADVRDALVWDDTARANFLSNITGYALPPLATMGLLVVSTWCEGDGRVWFDDVAPVFEAALSMALLNQTAKFVFGRARPLARFGPPERPAALDDNTSFFSGHTAVAFAQAVSAGVVAHRRGYRLEPVIWASGLALATATGYLRIAADKHYLSDVVVGAAAGIGIGLLVPRIFHRDVLGIDVTATPTANGVALTGTF